jgi:two-component system cell cycle response regulator
VGLRTRLSLAFVFVVLVPVVVGGVLVAIVAPNVLRTQLGDRLGTARTSAAQVLAARCAQAMQTAQVLGLEAATLGPDTAVARARQQSGADYAVVVDTAGKPVAAAGSLPGSAGTPALSTLDSCSTGQGASTSMSATAQLAIADRPDLRAVAVAWAVGTATAQQISAGIEGTPDVTLVAGGHVVSTTLPAATAQRLNAAVAGRSASGVRDVGSRVVAYRPAGAGEPFSVIVSDSTPNTTGFTWLIVGVIVLSIAAGLVIGRLLARLISRPVAELSDAAQRVAGGDLDITLPVRSRDEVGRLAVAFNHMTTELRNYVGELQRSRDELRRNLDRLGTTLTHTHDLAGILDVVLDTAIGSVQATAGSIMFLDGEGNLTPRVRRGEIVTAAGADARIVLGHGITGRVAQTGEAVRGVVGDGPGLRPAAGEPAASSVIAVPLRQSGRIVGVLNLYDKADDRAFTATDLESTLDFAGQASVAIDNVLLHQEAQRLSLTDPLTGLWNYRYLTLGLGHEIERATRFGRPLTVLMLDLDRFKQVNDQHGHQVGDAVLIELAARMRTEVREVDTLARYGGEEFVVVLPETDAAGAARTADRLGAVIRSSPFCATTTRPLDVTASMGVAVFPEHGTTPSRLLRSADDALYAAKAAGRDCWRFAVLSVDGDADADGGEHSDDQTIVPPATGASDEAALREAFEETSPMQGGRRVVVMPDVGVVQPGDRGRPRGPEA